MLKTIIFSSLLLPSILLTVKANCNELTVRTTNPNQPIKKMQLSGGAPFEFTSIDLLESTLRNACHRNECDKLEDELRDN